jgi:hypothetical protein
MNLSRILNTVSHEEWVQPGFEPGTCRVDRRRSFQCSTLTGKFNHGMAPDSFEHKGLITPSRYIFLNPEIRRHPM